MGGGREHRGAASGPDAGRGRGGSLRLAFEAPGRRRSHAEVLHPYRFCSADADVQVREADFRDPFALLRLGEVDALVTLLPTTEPEPRDRSSSPSRWCWPCRYGIRSPGSTP